jgi:hypothetical protein
VAPAQQKVPSIDISVTIAINPPMPVARNINAIAPPIPVSDSGAPGAATVPATIARIVAVNKLINFFILTPATSATLCGRYRRQGRQQKQTHQHQDYLAITFHQPHNTSINPNCNPVRRG